MSMMMLTVGTAHGVHQLGSSLAMFQADRIDSGNAKTLTTFVVIAAIALASQALAICGVVILVFKLRSEVLTHIVEIKSKVMPLVDKSTILVNDLTPQVKSITAKTESLITDLSPHIKDITVKAQGLMAELSPQIVSITTKVHSITSHAEEISVFAKERVLEFGPTITAANDTIKQTNETVRATVQDVNGKTRAQIDRVNEMVTDVLYSVGKIGKAIENGITKPAREVSGLVSGAKAAFDHLYKRYGGVVDPGALGSFVGFGKKPVSPYTPQKPVNSRTSSVPVTHHSPEGMGTSESSLPSAFGSTRRDLDL